MQSTLPKVRRRRWRTVPLLLAAGLSLCSVVGADDVHLHNGNVFEEVVAHDRGDHVVLELGSGELKLPKSRILRIERALTAAQEHAQRRDALLASDAAAAEWLELARWARTRGLAEEALETSLRVAAAAPELVGLAALLRPLGYVLDEEAGWITVAEQKRRQGFVAHRGTWLTPAERELAIESERREHERAQMARQERDREQQLRRALEKVERLEREAEQEKRRESAGPSDNEVAMAQIDLLEDVLETVNQSSESSPGHPFVGVPIIGAVAGRGVRRAPAGDDTWRIMSVRQPGSLITVDQFRSSTKSGGN